MIITQRHESADPGQKEDFRFSSKQNRVLKFPPGLCSVVLEPCEEQSERKTEPSLQIAMEADFKPLRIRAIKWKTPT